MKVQIINNSSFPLPEYQTELSSGMDVRANIQKDITLLPMERRVIPTGISIAIPEGHEVQVRPRSGLAAKQGLTVLNAPGTIDADYRGEIGVIIVNLSNEEAVIRPGDRVAQLVLAKHEHIEWEETDNLSKTKRGTNGLGSTGLGISNKDYSSPIVLEFCPKVDDKQTCNVNLFHYNWIKNGKPESTLLENNYHPLVIFDSSLALTERFKKFYDTLRSIGKSDMTAHDKLALMYEMARSLEDGVFMKTYDKVQAVIEECKKKYLG